MCQVQRAACMATEILRNLKFCNKRHVIITRNFYNSKGAVNFLLHNIRDKRRNLDNIVYKETEDFKPTLILYNMFFTREPMEKHQFLALHWKEWWARTYSQYKVHYEHDRYKEDTLLGPEIAATKFVLRQGGKVKLYGQDNWLQKIKGRFPDLPETHDPDFVVESIDINENPIPFDNWQLMCNTLQLRWLSVRGCSTVNDWVVDKIAMEFPALEYLDISDCKDVTDKGLVALYKMPNLKKLIVTNFCRTAAFELTCMMLEDINPYLKCEILEPDVELLEDEEEAL